MSANTFFRDYGSATTGDYGKIDAPASGATFKQKGIAFGTATVGAGTYILPDGGLPMYVRATGAVTLTSAAPVTIATLASGEAALCIPLTSTTWSATVLAANAVGINTAAELPIADAGSYTTTTTVEAALQSLLRDTQVIDVPLSAFFDADGDPLAKFADNASPNPGINLANSEALGLRWNNNATQNQPLLASVLVPAGAAGSAMTLHVLASKTGATVGDATTFTVTAFENSTGALHDAGDDLGGVTSAMTGDATAKTVQHVTLALANMEGTAPAALTFTITPTSGTLGTDDVVVERVWFSYASTS
jgi:hypothetical protein